jgi:uroporphyrin-3 C-methyltransferase
MADNGSDNARLPGPTGGSAASPGRTHTYSRLTTALAVLATATAGYALLRLDDARERIDDIAAAASAQQAQRELLRAELQNHGQREQQARRELERRFAAFDDLPKQVQDLANATEELRGRTEGPERAWSRAEALYLLELAQRRLILNRDIDTAIVALEAADARLASMRAASFAAARQQIARELQALRAVRKPDTTGIATTLASLEERVPHLPVKGIIAVERRSSTDEALPDALLPRAWAMLRNAASNLLIVRKVDDAAGGIVTKEEALLRREHLQLLLFSARSALARHDAPAYRSALAGARTWLGELFDLSDPGAQATLKELQALEPIQIDPPLPDIASSSRMLRKLSPVPTGPE